MGKISLYNALTTPVGDDIFYIYDVSEQENKRIKKSNLVASSVFLSGDLKFSAKNTPDAGFLICDGSAVNRVQYADLFSVIGETYGEGDGVSTFNLPDFKGKLPIPLTGMAPFESEGDTGGDKTHTVTVAEMAAHTHDIDNATPTPDVLWYEGGPEMQQLNGPTLMPPADTGSTGGGGSHNNLMSFLTIGSVQIKI
jgi:microcystin-dependent protein